MRLLMLKSICGKSNRLGRREAPAPTGFAPTGFAPAEQVYDHKRHDLCACG
jgi:hypothetical protein